MREALAFAFLEAQLDRHLRPKDAAHDGLELANGRALHAALRAKGVRQILMTPVPPMHLFPALPAPLNWVLGQEAKRYNHALTALAQNTPDLHLLDFTLPMDPSLMAADGFHPAPALYRLWADTAARALVNTFAPPQTS